MSTHRISRRISAPGVGTRRSAIRAGALPLVMLLLASIAMLVGAVPAHAAARVDVSPTPNADGATTVTLSGSGFQYQPNAPGGVYVFFGAVSDPTTNSWAPSQGGRSGESFAYAATGGARLLVAFQGGASAEAANGMIDASGNWSTQMTIPGSKFTATFGDPHSDNQQAGQEIDCLQVQCGIITIGAHGMPNANNESFTPVSFATAGGQVQSGSGSVQDFGGSAGQSNNDEATTLDVPGAEEAADEEADDGEEIAAAPQETAENTASENVSTPTLIVFGVLAFALLSLIVAIALVLLKRAKTRKPAVAAAPTTASGAEVGEERAGAAEAAEAEVPEEASR